jgi:AcrR family transcriptional regulator
MRSPARSRRLGVPPARRGRGGVEVSEVQRSRMLSSAVAVVSEYGYGQMSVARVTGRARVSRRTFYNVFEDREDCFLAVFDDAVARVAELVVPVYESAGRGSSSSWRERVRAALAVLLVLLDEQPQTGSLLVVDALRAGPRVLERRAQVLEGLGMVLDREGSRSGTARELSPLTGEGVVGAVFSVIHTRLLTKPSGSLVELLSSLMGMIVLPYEGQAAAQRELGRSLPEIARASRAPQRSGKGSSSSSLVSDPLVGLPMRLTYRTLRVLAVIGECPGASNREIADRAGVSDQGQISKLLARLERLGLIENTVAEDGHRLTGEPNAWRLSSLGEEVRQAVQSQPNHAINASHSVNGIEGSR